MKSFHLHRPPGTAEAYVFIHSGAYDTKYEYQFIERTNLLRYWRENWFIEAISVCLVNKSIELIGNWYWLEMEYKYILRNLKKGSN